MSALERMQLVPRHISESWVGKLWPALAAIVLGITLARWMWILFAPTSMAVLPSADMASGEDAAKLFGVAVSSVSGSSTVVLPGARLVGVFAPVSRSSKSASKNKNGFAIFQLDEKRQAGVALGEEVVPGVKLREIYADRVVLERDGVTQLVKIEGVKAGENLATTAVNPHSPNTSATTAAPINATVQAPAAGVSASHAIPPEMPRPGRMQGFH
ncbi:MAG TPA: type II secretion system protein N [Gammaproteobacteria bacterium]|nr:type II secretion system protein N [Gammaproteobacteria bacterium]